MRNLFLLVFLTSITTFGQSEYFDYGGENYPFYRTLKTLHDLVERKPITFIIKGSPYIENNFRPGTAFIQNGTNITAPMRYNAHKNVIEFLANNKQQKELLRRPYIRVDIEDKTYVILKYSENSIEKLGYFNTLNDGNTQLLFRQKKILTKDRSRGGNEIHKYYKNVSSYFIKKGDGPAKKINLNKASILNYLNDKPFKLKQFIVDHKLNLKKEKDVARLLHYYDYLLKTTNTKEMQS